MSAALDALSIKLQCSVFRKKATTVRLNSLTRTSSKSGEFASRPNRLFNHRSHSQDIRMSKLNSKQIEIQDTQNRSTGTAVFGGAYENTGAATTKGCLLNETRRTPAKSFHEIRSPTLGCTRLRDSATSRHTQGRSNQRCASLPSDLVSRAKRNQECNQLCKVSQSVPSRCHSRLRCSRQCDRNTPARGRFQRAVGIFHRARRRCGGMVDATDLKLQF